MEVYYFWVSNYPASLCDSISSLFLKFKCNYSFLLQDLNIGLALWLASSGSGWVYEESIGNVNSNYDSENCQSIKYKSEARILLVGSGADEQCAGYGRHRTKYRNGRYSDITSKIRASSILDF